MEQTAISGLNSSHLQSRGDSRAYPLGDDARRTVKKSAYTMRHQESGNFTLKGASLIMRGNEGISRQRLNRDESTGGTASREKI